MLNYISKKAVSKFHFWDGFIILSGFGLSVIVCLSYVAKKVLQHTGITISKQKTASKLLLRRFL